MSNLLQDLRYAARKLRQSPGSSAVAVITLALAIGAATATYSVVEGVLLRSLPVHQPDRLIDVKQIFEVHRGTVHGGATSSRFVFEHVRRERQAFEDVAGYVGSQPVLTGMGDAERVKAWSVTSNFLPLLGVAPVLGRGFLPEEEEPGATPTAVLSHGFWTQRFGGDPAVIGRTIMLDGVPTEMVGVLPPGFSYPPEVGVWRSIGSSLSGAPPSTGGAQGGYWMVARLRPGATMEQAQAQLDAVAGRLAEIAPGYRGYGMNMTPLQDYFVHGLRRPLLLMLGAVALFLLVATANVANLLLARAAARQPEIGVRSALGASRSRIVRQLFTEALLLAAIGGAAGVLLAWWGVAALVGLGAGELPEIADIRINPNVLVVSGATMLLTGLLFGLAPALHVARRLNGPARIERVEVRAGRSRVSDALISLQIALTMILLTGAGLLLTSFWRLVSLEPGYRSNDVIVAQFMLPEHRYGSGEARASFATAALERAQAIPAVESAALSSGVPLALGAVAVFHTQGEPEDAPGGLAGLLEVTPDYFRTFGIPLLRGRVFAGGEEPQSILVSAALARQAFPGEDPIGKWIRYAGTTGGIVGVVGDTRQMSLTEAPGPTIYQPFGDDPWPYMTLSVQTVGDVRGTETVLRDALRELDPHLPVDKLSSMQVLLSESLATQRFYATILGFFAAATLLIAAVGLFGLVLFTVNRRTRELGVRVALGASRLNVVRLVLGRTALATALGIVAGAAGGVASTRLLEVLLYGVRPTQPGVFAAAALLLAGLALLASYLPARRAARVDPIVALRAE